MDLEDLRVGVDVPIKLNFVSLFSSDSRHLTMRDYRYSGNLRQGLKRKEMSKALVSKNPFSRTPCSISDIAVSYSLHSHCEEHPERMLMRMLSDLRSDWFQPTLPY